MVQMKNAYAIRFVSYFFIVFVLRRPVEDLPPEVMISLVTGPLLRISGEIPEAKLPLLS
jgi:hypothetical protein